MHGIEAAECPVSLITAASLQWVDEFSQARRAKESFGAPPFSGGLEDWPAAAVDAFELLDVEHGRVEEARLEAERSNE